MINENWYTDDATGIKYVSRPAPIPESPCAGCAHENEDDAIARAGCIAAPFCARIIWVKAEGGSQA